MTHCILRLNGYLGHTGLVLINTGEVQSLKQKQKTCLLYLNNIKNELIFLHFELNQKKLFTTMNES